MKAMESAKTKSLGEGEGYVAKIPGFRGLLAVGKNRKEALVELDCALQDWIDASLSRGVGSPSLLESKGELIPA